MTELILASGSQTRRRILQEAGAPFRAFAADLDEDVAKDALLARRTPLGEVALALAELKARQVASQHPDALVLGADQTLIFDHDLVSKCADLDAARVLLRRLRAHEHKLSGGLVLMRGAEIVWCHRSLASLTMRAFSDEFLERYLAEDGDAILSSVGCYRLEGLGGQLFESIVGDYFAILGLPLLPVLAELRKQGVLPS